MSKKEISLKKTVDVKKAIAYLGDIISCMRNGTVCVQNCEEYVTLKPEASVELQIEAVRKKDKESLIIELSWRKKEEEETVERDRDLKITAEEPVATVQKD